MDWSALLLLLPVVGMMVVTTYWSISEFVAQQDVRTSRMLVLVLIDHYFSVSIIFFTLGSTQLLNRLAVQHYLRTGVVALFIAILILIYLLLNPIYSDFTQIMGYLSFTSFAAIIGLVCYDILYDPLFITYEQVGSEMLYTVHPLAVGLLITATFFVSVAFVNSSRDMQDLPENLVPRQYSLKLSGVLAMVFLSLFLLTPVDISFGPNTDLLIMLNAVNILLIYLVYSSINKPFLHVGLGTNPQLLVQRHLVGYISGYSGDRGPELLSYDPDHARIHGFTQPDFEAHIVSNIVALGINQRYPDVISILPFGDYQDFAVINKSFTIKKGDVEDARLKEGVPAMISVVLPSFIYLKVRRVNQLNNQLQDIIQGYDSFDFMTDTAELQKLTLVILRSVLI